MVKFKINGITTWLTITIHILPNIPQSKSNQAMKFNQLIKYNKAYIFCKNQADNEVGRLVPDLSLFLRKALYEVKASGLQLSFDIF